ncbi:hypothetical protein J437_LFUL017641 [Ladona fulva]|uniref:Serine/threonine-protein kinase Chk2 n=1 Tax=Ladona fulva TaxID=123851 RepID=A0A8K0KPE8_LADFU|nr:hypothetical protein J437_LFUL017641 [Ladona fulva]
MSQDDEFSESPPSTYPLDTDPSNFDYQSSQNEQDSNSSFWGRLVPMSTNLRCSVIDLERETYLFGRQVTCDFVFSNSNTSKENIKFVSKQHFKICYHCNTTVSFVSIEDLSSNGTFVNGVKVGRGKTNPLKNNDVISLALPHVQVFVYIDLKVEDDTKYPPEIKRRYTITKELGRGACGRVKLVFEKATCKMLAMKIIQKSKNSSGGISDPKKIKSEVKILKSLNHPFVITIEDFVDTPDECYIILTLAEGGDLMKHIQNKQCLSEKEAKKIFYQIALAVEYLHSCGIAHRDLKPQNILLTGQGRNSIIKVTDFGLSKTAGSSENGLLCSESWSNCGTGNSLMKTVCGSPLYVAPEVLTAALHSSECSGYTKKVDIWSMGVILYLWG